MSNSKLNCSKNVINFENRFNGPRSNPYETTSKDKLLGLYNDSLRLKIGLKIEKLLDFFVGAL